MFEGPVQDLIDGLGKLPGIGPKCASGRLRLLSVEPPDIDRLTAALGRVRDGVRFCAVCGNVSESERCRICSDPRRDASLVCVVEEPKSAGRRAHPRVPRSLPRMRWGIGPAVGCGPDQLGSASLTRSGAGQRRRGRQVIIATDPTPRARRPQPSSCGCCANPGANGHRSHRACHRRRLGVRRRTHLRSRAVRPPGNGLIHPGLRETDVLPSGLGVSPSKH